MSKFVTLKDLAAELNLSHTTVSRALNNHTKISKSTKEKVVKLADKLGYRQHPGSSLLKDQGSKILAVIIPDITIYFFAKIVEYLQIYFDQNGYYLLILNSNENEEIEIKNIEKCLNLRVEGVLAAISSNTQSQKHFQQLAKREIPLVFFDRVVNFLPVPKIITDDYHASFEATEYLIHRGCKTIAHITASINLNNSNNRLYGYLDALKEHHIPVQESLIFYYEMHPESIEQFIIETLGKFEALDAISVFNDYIANIVINSLTQFGKKVPEDISVFGFSDEPIATQMRPQLSSVEQVAPKMAQLSAQKLLAIIRKEEDSSDQKIKIKQSLVIRQSTI